MTKKHSTSGTGRGIWQSHWPGLALTLLWLAAVAAQAQVPPSIIEPPQSQTVPPGGTATFTVTAGGSPPLSYQWRKEGLDIPGANSATLVINGVQPVDAGSYTVAIYNEFGMIVSPEAILTVGVPSLAITTAVLPGRTVNLPYNFALNGAGGTPPYTWSVLGGALPPGLSLTATNGLISGTPTAIGQFGFTVVLSDSAASNASRMFSLTVHPAPPGLPVAATMVNETFYGFASDGTNYLVVLSDGANLSAQLVSAAGTNLGGRISLSSAAKASLADFDGTNYLVVWEQRSVATNSDLYGQFLSPAGALLGSVFPVCTNAGNQVLDSRRGLQYGAGAYLVVWRDERNGTNDTDVYGQIISPVGTLVGAEIPIAIEAGNQVTPSLAFGAGNYLVVWGHQDTNTGWYGVRGQLVAPDGTLTGASFPISQTNSLRFDQVRLAYNGSRYLVTWAKDRSSELSTVASWEVVGSLLTAGGTMLSGELGIASAAGTQLKPSVISVGTDFLVNWMHSPDATNWTMLGRYFDANGAATSSEFPLVGPAGQRAGLGPLVFDGKKLLAFLMWGVWAYDGQLRGLADFDIYRQVVAAGPPRITAAPESQFVTVGSPFNLGVMAMGASPLAFQWQLNGTNLPGATNSVFSRAAADLADAGSYTVVISNALGSVTSQVAALTVFPPPTPVVSIQATGNDVVVQWPAVTGQDYVLDASSDLSVWYPLASFPSATGGILSVTDTALFVQRFYRVRQVSAGGTVYSINVVGCVRRLIRNGENLIANPLHPPNNTLASLLPNVPDGTQIRKWDVFAQNFVVSYYDAFFGGWDQGNLTLNPGEGAILINPDLPFELVFVGEVMQGTLNNPLPAGYSLRGSMAPVSGLLTFPAEEGDVIITHNPVNQTYITNTYFGGAWDTVPQISPSDGFWVGTTSARTWVQNFFAGGVSAIPAIITAQPQNQAVLLGQTATFTVTAVGDPPLTYQWRFGGEPLAGANAATLTLTNVTAAHRGFYSVVVSNAAGTATSSNAYLEILEPPTIVQAPVSRVVFVGGSAVFKVSATGSPPLTYQWLHNGVPIEGATATNLLLAPVTAADAGNYAVAISNAYGTTVSSAARLEVRFQCAPLGDEALAWWEAESNALDTVGIHHGYLTNGAAFAPGKRGYAFALDGLGAYVRIPGNGLVRGLTNASVEAWVRPKGPHGAGAGTVFVEQTDTAGARLRLAVQDDGRILVTGRDQAADTTNAAPHQIQSLGVAPLNEWTHVVATWEAGKGIRLYVNGQLDSQLNAPLGALSTSVSPFIGIGRWDEAAGARQEFNGDLDEITVYGRALSDEEALRLYTADAAGKCNPPTILQQPQSVEVLPGGTAAFTVKASGLPPLRYEWRHNGQPLPGSTNATLVITNVQLADAGSYSVVVQDEAGSTRSAPAILRPNIPELPFADNFAESYHTNLTVTTLSGYGRGSNVGATREPGEPLHAGKRGSNSVWITLISPIGGYARLSTAGSSFDTVLGVYTGTALGPLLTKVADDDDGGPFKTSALVFDVEPDQEYHIAIDGLGKASGSIVLSWEIVPGIKRVPQVTNQPSDTTVSEGASLGFNLGVAALAEVKWYFNGAKIGLASRLDLGQVTEAHVGTYQAFVTQDGVEIALKPIIVQINNIDGRVDPRFMARDKFLDSFDPSLIHRNLVKQERRPLNRASGPTRGYVGTQVFNTYGATAEEGEPIHGGIVGGASEWFTYQAPADGRLTIHTGGSDFDTILAVYYVPGNTPPNDFSELVSITYDNDSYTNNLSIVSFNAVEDMIYYVAVDGVAGATGIARLNYQLIPPPSITGQPANQMVRIGGNALFEITAGGTNLHYQWQFNTTPLASATNTTLVLTNVQSAQAGNYSVIVSNDAGAITSAVGALTVLGHLQSARPVLSNGQFRLVFENLDPGTFLSIQGTTNLTDWFTVWSNTPAGGTHEFIQPASSNRLFFRAAQGK